MIGRPKVPLVLTTPEQQALDSLAHRVRRLEAAIWEFLDTSNAAGKPFVWTKSADEILASIARFAQRTLVVHN